MVKQPRKRLKKQEELFERSSRQLKYLIKYHSKKYSTDVEVGIIAETQKELDSVVEIIISNHFATRGKIKQLIYFVTQRKEWVMAEEYIDKFLDCLIEQSKKNKNITLDPCTLVDSKINTRSWLLFHKISSKRNRKK